MKQSWLRDGIFYFELDRKIPKSRGSGSEFENPEKILKGKCRKYTVFGIFYSRNFYPRDSGFFRLGIFIPGVFFNFDNKIIRFFLISGYPDKKPPLLIKCLNIKNTYWYNAWFFVL